jgi:hypothetical protein
MLVHQHQNSLTSWFKRPATPLSLHYFYNTSKILRNLFHGLEGHNKNLKENISALEVLKTSGLINLPLQQPADLRSNSNSTANKHDPSLPGSLSLHDLPGILLKPRSPQASPSSPPYSLWT